MVSVSRERGKKIDFVLATDGVLDEYSQISLCYIAYSSVYPPFHQQQGCEVYSVVRVTGYRPRGPRFESLT